MFDENTPCGVAVEPSGLEFRTDVMLERDRGQVSLAAHALAGTSDRGEDRTTPPFTFGAVRLALASDNAVLRRSAALLLGRCRVDGPDGAIDALIVSSLTDELDARVRAELGMSAVVRGTHRSLGMSTLEAILDGGPSDAACIAAAYLAQAGQTAGWPSVAASLDGAQPTPLRVTATHALAAFAPLQGMPVSGASQTVDAYGLVRTALADPEISVRQTAAAAIFEIRPPDGVPLLEHTAAHDPAPGVRAVASHWLWHLRRALR